MQEQKLESLLKSSDYISQILEGLKNKLCRTEQLNSSIEQDAIEYIEKAIDLKMAFRFLADGIQTNRALVQVQKEQIQKKNVFLEGLQYYKATLRTQISQSKLHLVTVKDYIDEEPSTETDWNKDFKSEQQKILTTMRESKQRNTFIQQQQAKKLELSKKIQFSQEKYKKTFPQQVKKLYNQVFETSKIFNIQQVDALSISEFKSRKIGRIHSLLYPLKLKGLIDIKHMNQFQTEQLQITIEKGYFSLYDYARHNKIMIEQKQFKFYIAEVTKQSEFGKQEVLAVSISRRQDFTTEQIFNNLLLQQKVKPIYQNPKSEAERNTNNKYAQLNWIGQVLGAPTSLINGQQFVQKVKNRVFNLNLVKYAFENISKKVPPYFFPLFRQNQEARKMISHPILQSKKLFVAKCQKSNFQDYQKQIFIPEWVIKALNKVQILKEEQKNQKSNGTNCIDSLNTEDRYALNTYIEKNNLEEFQIKDFYSYYKFELLVEKSVLSGFILVPSDYPTRRSIVRLINFKKSGDSTQDFTVPRQITLEFEDEDLMLKNEMFSEQLSDLQAELNQNIDHFFKETPESNASDLSSAQRQKRKLPFILYFQINRLLSHFIQKSLNHTLFWLTEKYLQNQQNSNKFLLFL